MHTGQNKQSIYEHFAQYRCNSGHIHPSLKPAQADASKLISETGRGPARPRPPFSQKVGV